MNIFQQVFANVNRRNSELILRKENVDQNKLYMKKSPLSKKKPISKAKKLNQKKKNASLSQGNNDIKEAIEPILEANVRTLDSVIDASLLTAIEINRKGNETAAESNENSKEDKSEQTEKQVEQTEKFSLSTAVPEEKAQEIIENLIKTVQIESPVKTPVKSDQVDYKNVTPKADITPSSTVTPKSSSRLPRKINSIPKDRDYLRMPIPEVIVDDMDEDDLRQKFVFVSEKLYATQLQLEEANERNKQLEDRVYELEMRINEIQLQNFQNH